MLIILILLRPNLEITPSRHMLILFPGLTIGGAFLIDGLFGGKFVVSEAVANSITIMSVFMMLFWMLPRYLDQSLINPIVEVLKFVTIPAVIGGGLALTWRKTNSFLRGFLQTNAISMLGVLAFLYTHAPVRICNSYLISEQYAVGVHFLWAAIGLTLYWSVPLFFAPRNFQTSAQGKSLDSNSIGLSRQFKMSEKRECSMENDIQVYEN